jgi:hypothetical protein
VELVPREDNANGARGKGSRGFAIVSDQLVRLHALYMSEEYGLIDSDGDRVRYGQRVDGVVRLTDVPLEAGGRAYLVERGLEEEGSNANAPLHALIADYLRQASVLDAVPMAARNG